MIWHDDRIQDPTGKTEKWKSLINESNIVYSSARVVDPAAVGKRSIVVSALEDPSTSVIYKRPFHFPFTLDFKNI